MSAVLLTNAAAVMTGRRGEEARADADCVRMADGVITDVGRGLVPEPEETVHDVSGCVIYPGWVNTHHHLFQSVMKGVPAGINEALFGWLGAVPYPRLMGVDRELIETAATIGLAELMLSGTTACADHHYVYHKDMDPESADVLFEVADRLGIRFALCRGGATEAGRHPGYPNRMAAESPVAYIRDVERLAGHYHECGPRPMRQVVMAPTTPTFSVSPAVLRELAAAGRSLGLRLHSHLSETANYVEYCAEVHKTTPVAFCAENDWLGEDVWFAHMVHVSPEEQALMAETGTGVAHCPQSNCRLGSGVAPVPAMDALGVPISIGVDGAASNEAADMIQEAHTAWLVHRPVTGVDSTTVEDVIHWGSSGGARVLGMDGVGEVAPGQAADLAAYDLDTPRYFGLHDPAIAPVVAGGTATVRHLFVAGEHRVENGRIPGLDMAGLRNAAAEAVTRLR